jgi:hypothetical protein
MSALDPDITTIGGGVEAVHVIPLEEEIDRAVRAFEVPGGFRANRVYLLATVADGPEEEGGEALRYCHGEVVRRLGALGIETITVFMSIYDVLDVIRKVSSIVRRERGRGSMIYVNMSAGGPFVSVGTAIAAMVQDARLYYVRCLRYSRTPEEKLEHGNAIVVSPQVHFLENFRIIMPDARALTVLVELYRRGRMRTSELLTVLHERGVEGFEEDYRLLGRGERVGLLMRLNKGITGKLEKVGYIVKERQGRENVFGITESGKYVACVSGLLGEVESGSSSGKSGILE